MTTRSELDIPVTTHDELITRLDEAMILRGQDGKEFVPENTLRKLIDEMAVTKILESSVEESGRPFPTPISDLAAFYCKDAFKVFAILAQKDRLNLVDFLYQKLHNDVLPVRKKFLNDDKTSWEVESCVQKFQSDEKTRKLLSEAFRFGGRSPWGRNKTNVEDFCLHWQWPFVSPIFTKGKFKYDFPEQTRLPFTKSGTKKQAGTFYSTVEEKSVHVDYLPKDLELGKDDDGNPRVAIKQLKHTGATFERVANGEATVLEVMRGVKNEHLVKAIAYYRKGEEHYFMFPWAEMGNLWEFWMDNEPKMEREYMIWILEQLVGLASAIEELHHNMSPKSNTTNIRHGDLKPLNILCFKQNERQIDQPRLVITDVGLAKVQNEATKQRLITTSAADATIRYEAPELKINHRTARSRRFDIWSYGCICLEFVIWFLYGSAKLKGFSNLGESFCEIQNVKSVHLDPGDPRKLEKTAQMHAAVIDWINYMKTEDWRCTDDTAIRRLINLITDKLLKIELQLPDDTSDGSHKPTTNRMSTFPPQARTATEPPSQGTTTISQTENPNIPNISLDPAENESDSLAPKLLQPGDTAATWLQSPNDGSTDDLPRDSRIRAYAPEIREALKDILRDLKEEEIPLFWPTDREYPPGPAVGVEYEGGGNLGDPRPTWQQNVSSLANLDDQ